MGECHECLSVRSCIGSGLQYIPSRFLHSARPKPFEYHFTSPTVESVEPDNDVSLEGWTSCGAFSDWTNDFYNSSAFQQVASDNDDFLKSLPPYLDGRPVSLQNMVSDDEGRMRDDPSLCKHALLTQDYDLLTHGLTVERTCTDQ